MRRPVSHIMGRVETFSSKVPVFRLSAYRMIISCPPVARLISVRRTTSSIMRETAALILPVINVAIKPARASLARPVQQWWFLWYDINYPVVAFTGVTSRRYSVSWKPFIVISSLRPHFISSVSQSWAVTKDNGDGKHGGFGWPQVCQENESQRCPGGCGGIRASQNSASPRAVCTPVSLEDLGFSLG